MAYSLRLSGIGKQDGKELFRMEPAWWEISEVRKLVTVNWVKTNETGSYSDEDADISLDVARRLHEHFKPEILEQIAFNVSCIESAEESPDEYHADYVASHAKYVAELKEELHTIEAALGADAGNFTHFHLCIFEWESGF